MYARDFKVGDFVKLGRSSCENRDERMGRWEGTVEGKESFILKDGVRVVEVREWLRVNWGSHKEGAGYFRWLERPEDLVKV